MPRARYSDLLRGNHKALLMPFVYVRRSYLYVAAYPRRRKGKKCLRSVAYFGKEKIPRCYKTANNREKRKNATYI